MRMSALQAALCTVAMSMCVLLLAVSLSMAAAYVTDEEEAHFILQCRDFAHRRGFCAILPAASAAFCSVQVDSDTRRQQGAASEWSF